MRFRRIFICLAFAVLAFHSRKVQAQVFDDFDKPRATGDAFCKIVDSLFFEAGNDFTDVIITDSSYSTPVSKIWGAEKRFWFPAALHCSVVERGTSQSFHAVFLSKYTKEELISSYNNLIHQIQDCLPEAYTLKAKHVFYEKYYPVYDSELSYNGLGKKSEKPVIHIYIERNWQTQYYELIMEICAVEGA